MLAAMQMRREPAVAVEFATDETRWAAVVARDASTSWDLRCEVREQLIEYLQKHHPDSLPRLRTAAVEGLPA